MSIFPQEIDSKITDLEIEREQAEERGDFYTSHYLQLEIAILSEQVIYT